MSGIEIYIDHIDNRLHAVVLNDGAFYDLYVDPVNMSGAWASVYAGKIVKIDRALDAAIVDLGEGLFGLLSAKHLLPDMKGALPQPGDMALVQIKSVGRKASITENRKLPRLTMRLRMRDQDVTFNPDDKNPRLLRRGPTAVRRVIDDYTVFDHIHVSDRVLFNEIVGYFPDLAESRRLRLFKPEKSVKRLFDLHDIFGALEALKDNVVFLDGGGSIIVETTTALTVIDVNQGSCPSILQANQEAAEEVARQCRLRNLSGAILVDCIGMTLASDRAKLVERFEKIFAGGVANSQIHGFTRLGILEITRKRQSANLAEKLRN